MPRHDKYYGGGLTRLANPIPHQWLTDFTQVMESKDWTGYEYWGLTYGNFWALFPCRIRPHQWLKIGEDKRISEHTFPIWRCQRCGSQTARDEIYLITRGRD